MSAKTSPNNISHFFAHLARMKLIYRWPLMRNVFAENIAEHSLQVAFVAHALALIENKKFNGRFNPERIALMAMFHDCSEVLTGDLPTPIKYFNAAIADEYKKIEAIAETKLLCMLPEEFHEDYRPLILHQEANQLNKKLIKQADNICAYLKCLEELSAENHEFDQAKDRLKRAIDAQQSPAVAYFMQTFVPSFSLSLEDISQF